MSSRRLVASGALLFGFVMLGAFYSSELFPLPPWSAAPLQAAPAAAQAAGSQQPHEVTPENPVPRRLFSTPIPYPLEFAGTGYEAAVDMRVVVDATGSVVSATRGAIAISDPRPLDREQVMDAFARAAADALRLWQYDPPAQAPLAFYVGVEFRPGAQATVIQSERGMGVVAGPSGARLGPVRATAGRAGGTAAAPPAQPARLDRGFEDTVTVGPNTVRIGGGIGAPTRTKHVAPVYPPLARAANVSGVVILELRLDQQGRVADARILRSIPLLDQAALDAVRQWEYTPVLLNGAPVSAIMTVTVYFTPEV